MWIQSESINPFKRNIFRDNRFSNQMVRDDHFLRLIWSVILRFEIPWIGAGVNCEKKKSPLYQENRPHSIVNGHCFFHSVDFNRSDRSARGHWKHKVSLFSRINHLTWDWFLKCRSISEALTWKKLMSHSNCFHNTGLPNHTWKHY